MSQALPTRFAVRRWICAAAVVLLVARFAVTVVRGAEKPRVAVKRAETVHEAAAASAGCLSCHVGIEHANMHAEETVVLGCADCHGGDAAVRAAGMKGSAEYAAAERKAHVSPRFVEDAVRGGHPVRAYTRWLQESYEFVRFANPGDLRVANETCGGCHAAETRNVKNSMMTHGAMLWGAALYNNGAYPLKNPHFGEAYDADGKPERLRTFPAANGRRDEDERCAAVSRSAAAVGDFAAGKHAARV